jgi:hypothetical protein
MDILEVGELSQFKRLTEPELLIPDTFAVVHLFLCQL